MREHFGAISPDWRSLIDAAERHHLAPLVLEELRSSGAEIPDEHRARLENIRNLELARAVVRLHHIDELRAIGTSVCLLKGAAFATTLYPEPTLRPMNDIDVLVAREEFEEFGERLDRIGYVPVDVSDHATAYRKRTSGVVVEVHRELASSAAFLGVETGALLERSRPIGESLRTLSWEDHLLHLSLHASFQHGFRQAGANAWEARLISEREDFDSEAFLARARTGRVAPWVYGGLAMSAAVFGGRRLGDLLAALAESVPSPVVKKARRFRAVDLLSNSPDAVFGAPFARLSWCGWNLTTLSLLWEVTRPRAAGTGHVASDRSARILQLVKNHGLALVGSFSTARNGNPMGPTSASLGEVRDV
jgi:hypothetical protein